MEVAGEGVHRSGLKVVPYDSVREVAEPPVRAGREGTDTAAEEQAREARQRNVRTVTVGVACGSVGFDGGVGYAGSDSGLDGRAEARELHAGTHGGSGGSDSYVDGVEEHARYAGGQPLEAGFLE